MSIKITALYERLSRDYEMQGENDFTPFLNIMNEWYAKDISKKIRTMFKAKMQEEKEFPQAFPTVISAIRMANSA